MLKPLIIAACLILSAEDSGKTPTAEPVTEQPVQAVEVEQTKPAVDLHSPNPPPTNWEKGRTLISGESVDENTLTEQLGQTLLALVVVCILIYLVARFGLSRLTALRTGTATQTLNLAEKLSLDPKNSLYLVEVQDRGKLLLGAGDGGVRLICTLEGDTGFGQALKRNQTPLVDSTPNAEIQDDYHG